MAMTPMLVGLGSVLVLSVVSWRLGFDWGLVGLDPLCWALIFGSLVLVANSGDYWRNRFTVPGSRFVADRAYSLYLIHVEAIAIAHRLPSSSVLAFGLTTWLLSFVLAEILYRTIERPFMAAREFWRWSGSGPVPKAI